MGARSLRAHMHAFSLFKNQLWLRSARDVDSMGSTGRCPPPCGGGKICLHTRHISLGVVTILGSSANKLVNSARRPEDPKGPPSAKAQVDIWSTDATRARERFSYWRDAVCHAVFNISIEAPPDRFSARITARSAGPLRFATSELSGYQIVRTRRDIESAPSDHYSVFAQVHGQSVIHQCGEFSCIQSE